MDDGVASQQRPHVAVIGGGITGLAAAFELASRGVSFTLLEGQPRAGGLVRTDVVDGFIIEAGADSMLVQKPAALELCDALGLTPRLIATREPRTAYVLRGRRLHRLPSPSVLGIPTTWKALAGYDLLPWTARLRLAAEPWIPRRRDDEADEPVASFFRRRFGSATPGLIAQPLLGGIHAGDIERLSMRSLVPRFAEAEVREGSVLRAISRQPAHAGGLFRALEGGMQELVDAILARLPGGSVRLGSPATALARRGTRWAIATTPGSVDADAVILALPAFAAARLLAPVDPAAAALCGEVPYVSTASIALAFRRADVPHPLAGTGFVVARAHSELRITACTWVSSKWPGRAPEDRVLLRAFVGGAHDPGAVDLPDADLDALARREVGGVLGITAAPLFTRVYRWRDAGAQHHVGQRARMTALESLLAPHPGLVVAGSGFRSIGIPDCIADGRVAAAAAASFATMASTSSR